MYLRSPLVVLFCLLLLFTQQGCSIKKYIPQDKFLLNKVKIKGEPAGYDDKLYNLSRQKPNKKVLGLVKFNMWFYLLANKNKVQKNKRDRLNKLERKLEKEKLKLNEIPETETKKIKRQQRRVNKAENQVEKQRDRTENLKRSVWEAPVLLDSLALEASIRQMEVFLMDKGYMRAKVKYNVTTYKNRKAKVVYEVTPTDPYIINRVGYEIEDKLVDSLVRSDSSKHIIKEGEKYDVDKLEERRNRIYELLSDKGYFEFKPSYINYVVDTSLTGNFVDVYLNILNPEGQTRHKVYRIGNVHVEPEYVFGDSTHKDSIVYNNLIFHSNHMTLRKEILADFIFLKKGALYRDKDKRNTLNRLALLRTYQFIDIQFQVDTAGRGDTGLVHPIIRLTPLQRIYYELNLELNTSNQPERVAIFNNDRQYGVAGSYGLLHRNLGRRALQFDSRIRGAVDVPINFIPFAIFDSLINYQYGLSSSLIFPQLLSPFSLPAGWRMLPTQSSFNFNLLYEHNQNFNRTTATTNLTYQVTNNNIRYFFTPIELSLVNAKIISPLFRLRTDSINDPLIKNLFDQHVITDLRFGFLVNLQPLTLVKQKMWMLRTSMELGGLVPALTDIAFDNKATDSSAIFTKQLWGISYFNYTKLELDFRYYWPIFRESNLAARAAIGFGVPFFKSQILPFEKRFYVGGANSIRAWRARDLGPGTFVNPPGDFRYDKSGDVKIELSLEDRFPIYGLLQGALFLDAGNVWVEKKDPGRPGAKFSKEFYKEFAIGSGIGTRFDFSFFILRFDFGIPLRDPVEGWLLKQFDKGQWVNEVIINLGINYPF